MKKVIQTFGRSRLDPRQRQNNFSSSLCAQIGSGAHPISTGGPYPGVKRGRGVTQNTRPQSSAEVVNE
jgi:hypothetical protein